VIFLDYNQYDLFCVKSAVKPQPTFSALSFSRCIDAVVWVISLCHLSRKIVFQKRWRKKRDGPANPVHLEHSCWHGGSDANG